MVMWHHDLCTLFKTHTFLYMNLHFVNYVKSVFQDATEKTTLTAFFVNYLFNCRPLTLLTVCI